MSKQLTKDIFGWGFLLWLVGYLLGILFFMMFPPAMIGWIIMPIGLVLTLWVLLKKVHAKSFQEYLWLAAGWTLIAIASDYFFLVKVFHPADGYYKLDVYLYYLSMFFLPLAVAWRKKQLR